jgi:hypothetical protein
MKTARWLVAFFALLVPACSASSPVGTGGGDDGAPPDGTSPGDDGPAPTGLDGSVGDGPLAGGFQHPGVLVNGAQLAFLKAQVAAGAAPWKAAFDAAAASTFGSTSYTPHPIAVVQCGSYSTPDIGCTDEKNDASAAYTHALLYAIGGDPAHGQKAIQILNAWSSTLTAHQLSNAPLQSAWCASVFARAAEIMRYENAGWGAADVAAFEKLLENVYLPEVVHGSSSNGNWELSMAEATIAIGVFLDDASTFDAGVTMWKKRVPAYVYLASDGATPVPPPTGNLTGGALAKFWYSPAAYVQGLSQETCRDLGHVQYGLAAMTNGAETARIQGVDLYALESKRITAGYEFHASLLVGATANPNAICGTALQAVTPDPMWEIGFNEYANRLGSSLPSTQKLIGMIRPTGVDHHMDWETLTHAQVGGVGLP